ncbi:M23 family metallopeptidase [Agrobacterium tumefaciens]|uniref:M23 family metallopeptidase n=2 Tax=Agrobacterium tumefaciens TaxID=358 RepID=UPI00071388AB|nr:peptidase M24 [Rhizobium sp. Root564]NTC84154.1 M23 family metallopeptidase [Agrobacterium tumefaciens]NTD11679.1 M23 family metallopeptidase [Agrobacterium tumefaciens]
MQGRNSIRKTIGNDEPILADGRRILDRREISLRWLVGTFLVGVTSCTMMGYALFAAVEGRQQLAIPAEALIASGEEPPHETSKRGDRVVEARIASRAVDKAIVKVPVVVREAGVDVVRPESFSLVRMSLASNYKVLEEYPRFDPLTIFADGTSSEPPESRFSAIYSSDIASEISLKITPFPNSGNGLKDSDEMTADEVEQDIRFNGALLASVTSKSDNTYRVDPQRFADLPDLSPDITGSLAARVIEENVSTAIAEDYDPTVPEFADDIIPSRRRQTISDLLSANGYDTVGAASVEEALQSRLGTNELGDDEALRIGIFQSGEMARIVRISLYRRGEHRLTLAVNDLNRLVLGTEPMMNGAVFAALNQQIPALSSTRDQQTIYDGIYRAALSYGMTREMINQVMRLVAAKVDLQATTRTTDKLEAFFSVVDEQGKATPNSKLLFIRARFGDTVTAFYRFQDPKTKVVDYYDSEGKGLRPLLLRTPLPNARLTSNFGGRVNPVLGYAQAHTGTDLAAPQGSPIMAAGDGIVEKAGWAAAYGNQTIIRHANGYVSSYSHQSGIAKGVKEGVRVAQGQIIGFVGSTGRSTGPHLHYELTVNGSRVDAMKTRLPQVRDLSGEAYEQFNSDKQRIDGLLTRSSES